MFLPISCAPGLTPLAICTTLSVQTHAGEFKVSAHAGQAYLELPADDRLETRLPKVLKRHAETVAKSRGESLSEYVVEVLAERVANEIGSTQQWQLTATEQTELLRILAAPAPTTAALQAATRRAEDLFGI
ncbi:MAG: DUF1778 domain-containing protein [Gemmatimonadaceae bacterium]